MNSHIVYIQYQHPNLSETFVRAEINELFRRGLNVACVTTRLIPEVVESCLYKDKIFECSLAEGEQKYLETIKSLNPVYLHSHFVTESAKYAFPVAQYLNVPFGFTVHAYDIWQRGGRLEPELINQLSNHELCITAAVEGTRHREYLKWCGVPEEKIMITPNSPEKRNFQERKTQYSKDVKNILLVGRPVPKKGFLVAIDAVRLLRLRGYDVHLTIVGALDSSTEQGQMVKHCADQFPFVEVLPMLKNQQVLAKMRESDVLIMPSIVAESGDSDGIPTVLSESMLLGVPVITTDVGSITDLVVDGKTGLIARSGDPASLAEKIAAMDSLMKDDAQVSALVAAARERAESQQEASASVNILEQHLRKHINLPQVGSSLQSSIDSILSR